MIPNVHGGLVQVGGDLKITLPLRQAREAPGPEGARKGEAVLMSGLLDLVTGRISREEILAAASRMDARPLLHGVGLAGLRQFRSWLFYRAITIEAQGRRRPWR